MVKVETVKSVTVTLDEEQARDLCALLGRVAGGGENGRQHPLRERTTDPLWQELDAAGFGGAGSRDRTAGLRISGQDPF